MRRPDARPYAERVGEVIRLRADSHGEVQLNASGLYVSGEDGEGMEPLTPHQRLTFHIEPNGCVDLPVAAMYKYTKKRDGTETFEPVCGARWMSGGGEYRVQPFRKRA